MKKILGVLCLLALAFGGTGYAQVSATVTAGGILTDTTSSGTVATLPTGTTGDTAYVTGALTPTYLTTAVGGGAVVAPVFYDRAGWEALVMGGDHLAAAMWLRRLLHQADGIVPPPADSDEVRLLKSEVRLLKGQKADLENAVRNRDGQIVSLNSLVALWTSRAIALGYQDEGLGTPIPGTGPGGQPHD